MGKEIYNLAKAIKNGGGGRSSSGRPVELAQVVAVDPLAIQMGTAVYKSTDWRMYEQIQLFSDVKTKNGQLSGTSVSCSVGSASSVSYIEGTAEELSASTKYNVGDLLAVQQMAGDREFIILCKLREVTNNA